MKELATEKCSALIVNKLMITFVTKVAEFQRFWIKCNSKMSITHDNPN